MFTRDDADDAMKLSRNVEGWVRYPRRKYRVTAQKGTPVRIVKMRSNATFDAVTMPWHKGTDSEHKRGGVQLKRLRFSDIRKR